MQNTPPINDIKAKRRNLDSKDKLSISIFDMGLDLIGVAGDGAGRAHVARLMTQACRIAEYSGLSELADFFYGAALNIESSEQWYELSYGEYLYDLKIDFNKIADKVGVNPSITTSDQELLDKHTLPIHQKMMESPADSPDYFIEMAHQLNRLISDFGLSELAASDEISHALDRPEIMQNDNLASAIQAAYRLEFPYTLRQADPGEQWQELYEEILGLNPSEDK